MNAGRTEHIELVDQPRGHGSQQISVYRSTRGPVRVEGRRVDATEYFFASSVAGAPAGAWMFGESFVNETMVFPCDGDGNVTDFGAEVVVRKPADHTAAIEELDAFVGEAEVVDR